MAASSSPNPPAGPGRVPGSDPFDLLGVEPVFELDGERVRRAFLARSARLHPDSGIDAEEDGDSPLLAALNRAKAALLDPEQRADALLLRLGGPSRESERTLPAGFLMEMMDARERMETEIQEAGGRERWRGWAAGRRRESIEAAAKAFREATALERDDPARPKALAEIRRGLNAWRYFERMLEQLDPPSPPSPPAAPAT